jgi:uncharacterized protein YeaO (DUF488 family)
LIERLSPRGVKRVDAAVDEWITDIAPQHRVAEVVWGLFQPLEFRSRYGVEIQKHSELVDRRPAPA